MYQPKRPPPPGRAPRGAHWLPCLRVRAGDVGALELVPAEPDVVELAAGGAQVGDELVVAHGGGGRVVGREVAGGELEGKTLNGL